MSESFHFTIVTMIFIQCVAVDGISCYQCTLRPLNHGRVRLCSKFNTTPEFEVDCPYSTFCMKKTFTLPLQNTNVVVDIRDCAPQKELRQVPINGAMQWETTIVLGLYENGCTWRDNRKMDKINSEQICYCDTHLCNGQSKNDSTAFADLLGVVLVFNAVKYVRSFY